MAKILVSEALNTRASEEDGVSIATSKKACYRLKRTVEVEKL